METHATFLQLSLRPWYMLAVIIAVLGLFLLAEILRKYAKMKIEVTRKFVHICAGLVGLSFPYIFESHLSVLILLVCFLLLLLMSQRYHFLDSINAISRKSLGSLAFPVIVYICFVVYIRKENLLYYNLPLIIFILCDPLAAFVGIQTKWKPYRISKDIKTLAGSLAFLVSSFLLAVFFLSFEQQLLFKNILQYAIVISFGATLAEAASPLGLDNLFVPLSILAMLQLLNI